MRLLFITSTRIGDAVLTTGILNHFITQFPGLKVSIACGPLPAPLFKTTPGLENLYILKKKSYSRHWIDLWKQCRGTYWDIIVDLRGSLVSYGLKCGKRYVWRSTTGASHRVEQLATLVRVSPAPGPRLWFNALDAVWVKENLPMNKPILALAPIANWIGKQWPMSSFIDIAQRFISTYDWRIAVFCAPHELSQAQPLIDALPSDRVIILPPPPNLRVVAACLEHCRLFLGNDSGLMHMSAAVGVPTMGVFGPSNDQHYGPWGPGNVIIRTPESLKELEQRPGFSYSQPYESYMTSLTPATVWGELQRLVSGLERKSRAN